jgi:hypothetical protein
MNIKFDEIESEVLISKLAMPESLMTFKELAEFLRVHPSWVRKETNHKDGIPCIRLRRRIRYNPIDVLDWAKNKKWGDN